MSLKKINNKAGFTLLEVMIALVILAVTSATLIKVITENVKNTAYLEEKTIAIIIAENQLNEIYARHQWPNIGNRNEEVAMSNRKWVVSLNVSDPNINGLRKVNVSVSAKDHNHSLASLTGFVGKE